MGTVERASGSRRVAVSVLAPLLGALALVAGCGSGSSTATASTTAPSVVASNTTSTANDDGEDTDTTDTPGAVSGAATLGAGVGGQDDEGEDDGGSGSGADAATSADTTPDEGILAETGADEVAPASTWASSATEYRGSDGLLVAYVCPADGTIGPVWGTDTYTDDSSVCAAAVHAGLINELDGGLVVIEISPGLDAYEGTTANGVTSGSYAAWSGSFAFVS